MATRKEHRLHIILYLLPPIILYSIFYYLPLALNVYFSFTRWDYTRPPTWIGLDNYVKLFNDPIFVKSLYLTAFYVIGVLGGSIVTGTILAIAINRESKLALITRIIMLIPYMLPEVAAASAWFIIFAPGPMGYANYVLSLLGMGSSSWFLDVNLGVSMLIVYSIWKNTGFFALVLYAGLKAIPKDAIEAAYIDGASEFQTYRRVIIPLLRPMITFLIITTIMSTWFVFGSVYVLTKGGPGTATMLTGMYMYLISFGQYNGGYGAALAVANTALILGIVYLQIKRFGIGGYGA
ncbi:MAG: sugar ABC transporter permease [Nitrososphaerota archaeon]